MQHKVENLLTGEITEYTNDELIELAQWEWIFNMKDEEGEPQTLIEDGYSVYLLDVSECERGRDNALYKKEHILHKTNISNLFI